MATWSLFTGPVTFNLLRQRSQSISGQESAVSMAVPYSGKVKVWILSIWRKKVWRINRLANRLLLVRCNNNNNYTDGFSLANHGRFAKLSRYSYGISFSNHHQSRLATPAVAHTTSCVINYMVQV